MIESSCLGLVEKWMRVRIKLQRESIRVFRKDAIQVDIVNGTMHVFVGVDKTKTDSGW